jgi:Protein of unknown function (DUF3592)
MIPVHLLGALKHPRTPEAVERAAMIPPELTGTIPRNVALTPGGVVLVVIATVMAVGGVVAAVALSMAYHRSAAEAALRARDAAVAQAEIVAVRVVRGDDPREILTYRYEVDGRPYAGEARGRLRKGHPTAVGDRIGIHYTRSAPQQNWTGGAEPPIEPPIFLIPLISLSMLGCAGLMTWPIRRQWMLLVDGRPALARITSSKVIGQQHGKSYRVNHEFQTMSGATVAARSETGRRPAPIGSIVPIVYHRESPKWTAMYPLQLVRPR